eukprot:COSAG05_NODE_14349_length_399_cov_0.990000_1_plen_132_part_11
MTLQGSNNNVVAITSASFLNRVAGGQRTDEASPVRQAPGHVGEAFHDVVFTTTEATGLQWEWALAPSSPAAAPWSHRRVGIVRKSPRQNRPAVGNDGDRVAAKLGVVSGMALISCHEIDTAVSSAFGGEADI